MDIADRASHPDGPDRLVSAGFEAPTLAAMLANGVLFNISWLAIVLTHSSLVAPLVVVLHLALHFRFFGYGLVEARLILVVTAVGLILDQALFLAGILTTAKPGVIAPLWLSCLWPVLATTLMHAFSRLRQRLVLASLFGAVGGGLSYLAGTRLSDIAFVSPVWGPAILAAAWAILFPALLMGAGLVAGDGEHNNDVA